jgi:hypothetical protein
MHTFHNSHDNEQMLRGSKSCSAMLTSVAAKACLTP